MLRVDREGKAFVLLDSPFQEIRALRFDDKGTLYVAAVSGRAGAAAPAPAPTTGRRRPAGRRHARAPVAVGVTTEITSIVGRRHVGAAARRGSARDDRRAAQGRRLPHRARRPVGPAVGVARRLAVRPRRSTATGALVVGTGNKGKIYRLEGDPLQPTLLARAGAQQVTALYKDARGRLYYATANPGKLFRLSSDRAPRGTYESEPRDAQMVATWGAISWRGTTPAGSTHRALHPVGQHRDARRHLERLVRAVHGSAGLADHQPEGALPAVARGAHRQERRARC